MANSTINIQIDVLNETVMLEIEVIWHMSVAGEMTIDDFYGYHFNYKTGEYTRIPEWLHKIIETTQLLEEEYTDLIDLNCDESTY